MNNDLFLKLIKEVNDLRKKIIHLREELTSLREETKQNTPPPISKEENDKLKSDSTHH